MNAIKVLTNVTLTPPATAPGEGGGGGVTTALAKTGTLEMGKIAQVWFMFVYSILYVE